MEQMEAKAPEQPKSMSALSGVTRVLFSPRQVFESVKERNNWVLPLSVLILIAVIASYIIFPVALAELPQRLKEIPQLSEEQREMILEKAQARLALGLLIKGFVALIWPVIVAAVFFVTGNILLGGEAKFLQMLSVVTLSFLVSIPEQLFKVALILYKQTLNIRTDLTLFLGDSSNKNFLFNFFGELDIFTVWKVCLLGLGSAIVYKFAVKKAMTAAFVVFGLYVIVAALMGTFLNPRMG